MNGGPSQKVVSGGIPVDFLGVVDWHFAGVSVGGISLDFVPVQI